MVLKLIGFKVGQSYPLTPLETKEIVSGVAEFFEKLSLGLETYEKYIDTLQGKKMSELIKKLREWKQ